VLHQGLVGICKDIERLGELVVPGVIEGRGTDFSGFAGTSRELSALARRYNFVYFSGHHHLGLVFCQRVYTHWVRHFILGFIYLGCAYFLDLSKKILILIIFFNKKALQRKRNDAYNE
jgi:hypothetical protein